jgi:hypothetical protein
MHLHNIAHWTCVAFGLLLVVTGLISRLHGRPSADRGFDGGVALKRVTLVLVGVVGVAYGAYRLVH